jgi:hypothetical protein
MIHEALSIFGQVVIEMMVHWHWTLPVEVVAFPALLYRAIR